MTRATRVSLGSTTLAGASYDRFRDGTRYTYSGIAPNLYRELLRATSKDLSSIDTFEATFLC
jgi:hypothetical protein